MQRPWLLLVTLFIVGPALDASAMCNVIPAANKEIRTGDSGGTALLVDRPIAGPGDSITLRIDFACTPGAVGFPQAPPPTVEFSVQPPTAAGPVVAALDPARVETRACVAGRCAVLRISLPQDFGLTGPATGRILEGGAELAVFGDLFQISNSCRASDRVPERVFRQFTLLPAANAFVSGSNQSLNAAVDFDRNLLLPFDFTQVVESFGFDPGDPTAGILEAELDGIQILDPLSGIPVDPSASFQDSESLRAFSREGRPIPPILELTGNAKLIFGSVDGKRSVLRFSRLRSGGQNFQLSGALVPEDGGPVVLTNIGLGVREATPLETLRAAENVVAFARDGDLHVQITDVETGAAFDTGQTVALYSDPTTGALKPALVARGSLVAFIQSEAADDDDANGDGDSADGVLRVYQVEVPVPPDPPALRDLTQVHLDGTPLSSPVATSADLGPVVDGRPLAIEDEGEISNPLVWFRTRESDEGPGVDLNLDLDTADVVMQVFDSVSQELVEDVRAAALEVRVKGSFGVQGVDNPNDNTFLFSEADEGGVDANNNGVATDLVLGFVDPRRDPDLGLPAVLKTPRLPAGLSAVDVSSPAAPVLLGSLDAPPLPFRFAVTADPGSDRGYVVDIAGLGIYDLSTGTPGELNFTGDQAVDVAAAGNLAYLAADGLRILDMSDPTTPSEVGFWMGSAVAFRVVVEGTTAYLLDDTGLRIVDVSAPALPAEIASLPILSPQAVLTVAGGRAYVVSVPSGVVIVDVSNPQMPTEIGGIPGEFPVELAVDGDRVYLLELAGLSIWDTSVPASPMQLGSFFGLSSPRGIAVAGSVAYVADDEMGLRILDVSDPAAVSELSRVNLAPGLARGVELLGNRAYVFAQPRIPSVVATGDPSQTDAERVRRIATGNGRLCISSPEGASAPDDFGIPEAGEIAPNGDLDSDDDVLVALVGDPAGALTPLFQQPQPPLSVGRLAATAYSCLFSVPESAEGSGAILNGDGDSVDEVLHAFNFASSARNYEIAASDFVVSDAEPDFLEGTFTLVEKAAVRVCEGEQGQILNDDGDLDDCVMHIVSVPVSDPGPGTLPNSDLIINTGFAADPCNFPGCDPFFEPYRFQGNLLSFVTHEAAQSGPATGVQPDRSVAGVGCLATSPAGACDLTGDGDALDTVITIYSLAREDAQTFEVVDLDVTPIDPFPTQQFGRTVLTVRVRESQIGEDINGDGAVDDTVVSVIIGDSDEDGVFDGSNRGGDNCEEDANADQADEDAAQTGDGLGDVVGCDPDLTTDPVDLSLVPDPDACDVNGDGITDRLDVERIFADRGQRSPLGVDPVTNGVLADRRDANFDGRISVLDSGFCAARCTNADCMTAAEVAALAPPPAPNSEPTPARGACGLGFELALLLPLLMKIRRDRRIGTERERRAGGSLVQGSGEPSP